ncbi:MAG: hypothetical protein IKI49_03440, partial [Oscillospiraceae bacterium]|nr:hypothetical protein [Oscillospiraceae bacterium]
GDLTCSAGVNPACAKVLLCKTLVTRDFARGFPLRASEKREPVRLLDVAFLGFAHSARFAPMVI